MPLDEVVNENDLEESSPIQANVMPIVDASQNAVKSNAVKSTGSSAVIMESKQKINNIAQKEDAMHYLGLTRKKYMRVIIDALEAYKWEDIIDRQGNVKMEWVPDLDKQKWGAEQAAKLFGDYIQHVDANIKVTHSVEELLNIFDKARLK